MFLLNGGEDFLEIMDKCLKTCYNVGIGSLAQLARAPRLHRGGQGFESLATHHFLWSKKLKKQDSYLASLGAKF